MRSLWGMYGGLPFHALTMSGETWSLNSTGEMPGMRIVHQGMPS